MLTSTEKWLEPELMDVVRLFPGAEELFLAHKMRTEEGTVHNAVTLNGEAHVFETAFSASSETECKSLLKRYAKLALYEVLSAHFRKDLPWGSLTGIRPTRLAYQELEKGRDFRPLFRLLKVSEENIGLVARVLEGQKGVYERKEGNVDLYVSLPFCPSKCTYCSFITAPIEKTRQFVPASKTCAPSMWAGERPSCWNRRTSNGC